MKIEIKGPIINDADQWIYDYFAIPATSPGKVNTAIDRALRNQDGELLVVVNSGGGSVFSAAEIYTALKSFNGKVKVQIVGMAASAASVISMAGQHVEMSPVAQLMIHNASTGAWGDYNEMDATSEFLQKVNQTITNAYRAKTSKTEVELLQMMNRTTWMTASEAKENGFIDAIMFENELDAVASIEHPSLVEGAIPKSVLDQLRQQLKVDPVNSITQNERGSQKMDLETLKNEHPELVNQIEKAAVNNERQRIQDIENISQPGTETIVNKAKFETGASAADTAMEILKAQKEQTQQQLQNRIADAKPLNQIEASEAPTPNQDAEVDNLIDGIL
ncbi:Clp protease ClpP [Lysinibacillus fusiformis]|uniref:head maturation protease, ClpP-related n=1 Tax=Lysinibacillus fusiformis TaxID=28031 RepID=UPI001E3DB365|nr:head maturation protease, ClpP-related [Lysinibacillus fusiformis]MCE4044566.1 Clp protease ClpP [Lysinibacillus fusiformis]